MQTPSPLARPRFTDDQPFSVWKQEGGSEYVAPAQAFQDASPLVHKHQEDWPWKQDFDGQPIGVELVRGAQGARGNEWTLVVDGVRCEYAPIDKGLEDQFEPADDLPTCVLPAPCDPSKELTVDTRVRPIACAVRLEEEALAPAKVFLVVQQITDSTERSQRTTEPGKEQEILETGRIELKPYNLRDPVAPTVSFPYPFAAPPHSALALASYREVEKYKERVEQVNNENQIMKTDYENKLRDYEAQLTQWTRDKKKATRNYKDAVKEDKEKMDLRLNQGDTERQARRNVGPKPTRKDFKENGVLPESKWTRAKPAQRAPKPLPDEVKDQDRSRVIGGRAQSVARALVPLFEALTAVCKVTAQPSIFVNDSGNYQAGMRTHLRAMLALLSDRNKDEAYALLETLLSGTQTPYAFVLRRRYTLDDDGKPVRLAETNDPGAGKKGYTEVQEQLEKIKDEEAGGGRIRFQNSNTSQFVYDRVPFVHRLQTTTRLRLVYEVHEVDGTTQRIALEPRRYDALVAHAVYGELKKDIADLDKAMKDFLDCFMGLWNDRDFITLIAEAATAAGAGLARDVTDVVQVALDARKRALQRAKWSVQARNFVWNWTIGFFDYGERAAKPLTVEPKQLTTMIEELRAVMTTIVPVWPEPAPLSVWTAEQERKDDAELEARIVAEVEAELAATSVAAEAAADDEADEPEEPDVEETEPDELDVQASAATIVLSADVDVELGRFPLTAPTAGDENDALLMLRTVLDDDVVEALEPVQGTYKRIIVDQSMWEEKREDLKKEVVLDDTIEVFVRQLPQIVHSQRAIVPTIAKPLDTAEPDEYIGFAPPQSSWLSWITAGLLGSAILLIGPTIVGQLLAAEWTASLGLGFITALFESAGAAFGNIGAGVAGGLAIGGPIALAFSAFLARGFVNYVFTSALNLGRSWSYSVNGALVVADLIVTHSKSRASERVQRGKLYHRAVRHARGVPIECSLAAAREALRLMGEVAKQEVRDYQQVATVSVIYNRSDYSRYRFRELYSLPKDQNTDVAKNRLLKLKPSWDDAAWATVPQTTALALVPPSDVVESLYEVEELRRLPVREAVERTVGVPPKLTPTTIAELAAKSAHDELMDTLRNGRFPTTGEHVLQSAARAGLSLAQAASSILQAAYGSSAGVTLVAGNDAIWTCLPAGVAARIALRHLPLFERAENDRLTRTAGREAFKSAIAQWRPTQRAIVDMFARAWVTRAQNYLVESLKEKPPPLNRRAIAVEAVRSFARVNALRRSDDVNALLMVAASYSALLSQPGKLTQPLPQVEAAVAAEQLLANGFRDQERMRQPSPQDRQAFVVATWASRRIDADAMREWSIDPGPETNLVTNVTDALSQLGVRDSTARHYYCPMGSRIDGVPGRTPFGITDLGARLVWLDALALAIDRVLFLWDEIATPIKPSYVVLEGTHVPVLGQGPGGLVGLGRHPLVITAEDRKVRMLLASEQASTPSAVVAVAGRALLLERLSEVITLFAESPDAGAEVQKRTAAMRSMAFNADRIVSSLDLVKQNLENASLHVLLPNSIYATSFCIAFAMHSVERTAVVNRMHMHVADMAGSDVTRAHLQSVAAACKRATGMGCKAVSLAEACATLAQ